MLLCPSPPRRLGRIDHRSGGGPFTGRQGRQVAGKHNSVIVGWSAIAGWITTREQFRHMPSLFRFLTIAGLLGAIILGGLYAMAVLLEPEQREMSTSVPGIKIRR